MSDTAEKDARCNPTCHAFGIGCSCSQRTADYDAVRLAVQNADYERKCADAADSAMRSIRLGYSPKLREQKRLWFGIRERQFTQLETHVLYEALQIVRRTHRDREADFKQQATRVIPPGNGNADA